MRKQSEITDCLVEEWHLFERLLRSLTAEDLAKPSRCEGLTVGDVAAHAVGVVTDIHTGATGVNHTEDHVAARKGWTPGRLADELRESAQKSEAIIRAVPEEIWNGPGPLDGMTIGQAVEAGILESVVHGDDVRSGAGLPSDLTTGVTICVEHVARRLEAAGWGPRTLDLEGMQPLHVGGEGTPVIATQWEFLLAATGRIDASKIGLDATVNIFAV